MNPPLDRRLGGPQSQSGYCGGEKSLPSWESNPSHHLVAELNRPVSDVNSEMSVVFCVTSI